MVAFYSLILRVNRVLWSTVSSRGVIPASKTGIGASHFLLTGRLRESGGKTFYLEQAFLFLPKHHDDLPIHLALTQVGSAQTSSNRYLSTV